MRSDGHGNGNWEYEEPEADWLTVVGIGKAPIDSETLHPSMSLHVPLLNFEPEYSQNHVPRPQQSEMSGNNLGTSPPSVYKA